MFAGIDPEAPVIVLLTAWQYSHHLAPSLAQHRGPILLLANFEGTWPGLVGMLCMAGTLTSLGKHYSRLWSVGVRRRVLLSRPRGLAQDRQRSSTTRAICTRSIAATRSWTTPAGRLGAEVGRYSPPAQGDHRALRHLLHGHDQRRLPAEGARRHRHAAGGPVAVRPAGRDGAGAAGTARSNALPGTRRKACGSSSAAIPRPSSPATRCWSSARC